MTKVIRTKALAAAELRKACRLVGSLAELAKRIGVSPQRVSNWISRGIPDDFCPLIEQVTAGRASCERLAPDTVWHRIPDPQWPGRRGRPLIDVSRAPAEARAA